MALRAAGAFEFDLLHHALLADLDGPVRRLLQLLDQEVALPLPVLAGILCLILTMAL